MRRRICQGVRWVSAEKVPGRRCAVRELLYLFLPLAAFEIDHQRRNVGGGDAGDAAGLAEARGADVAELLPCLEPQAGHLPVVEIRRQQPLFEPGELRHLPQLALDYARVERCAPNEAAPAVRTLIQKQRDALEEMSGLMKQIDASHIRYRKRAVQRAQFLLLSDRSAQGSVTSSY